jgi:hypothetical protein
MRRGRAPPRSAAWPPLATPSAHVRPADPGPRPGRRASRRSAPPRCPCGFRPCARDPPGRNRPCPVGRLTASLRRRRALEAPHRPARQATTSMAPCARCGGFHVQMSYNIAVADRRADSRRHRAFAGREQAVNEVLVGNGRLLALRSRPGRGAGKSRAVGHRGARRRARAAARITGPINPYAVRLDDRARRAATRAGRVREAGTEAGTHGSGSTRGYMNVEDHSSTRGAHDEWPQRRRGGG